MKIVRDLFLRCISSVYLFAFASLYVQIPGQFYDSYYYEEPDNGQFADETSIPKMRKCGTAEVRK